MTTEEVRQFDAERLCFECRAILGKHRTVSDAFPDGSPPPGMGWERFKCELCGINDLRLVLARPSRSKSDR